MHRFPQVASPLHIEPEIRAVAEHAGENERGRRGHIAAVVAQLIDCLRCTPMASASAPWVRPIGFMNSSTRISHNRRWLVFCHQHGFASHIAVIVQIYIFRDRLSHGRRIGVKFYTFGADNYTVSKRITYPGSAALARLAKRNLASYLRDAPPKQIDRELRSFSRAARLLSLRSSAVDRSASQSMGREVTTAVFAHPQSRFGGLIARLKKRGLSPNDTIIRYIDISGRKLILSSRPGKRVHKRCP